FRSLHAVARNTSRVQRRCVECEKSFQPKTFATEYPRKTIARKNRYRLRRSPRIIHQNRRAVPTLLSRLNTFPEVHRFADRPERNSRRTEQTKKGSFRATKHRNR